MLEHNQANIKKLMPCLLILFILANLMVQAFVIVSPALADDFNISANTVSMIVIISTIVLGVCSVIYGTLSDYIPVKKLLLFGITMFVVGSIIGLVFQNLFFMIVLARAIQTVGQAALSSLYLVIVSRYLEENEKIRYLAYFAASFPIAQALGVLAGGIIVTYISWKMLFAISLLSSIFIPAILKYAPIEKKEEAKHVDTIGISLFSVFIVFLTLIINNFSFIYIIIEIFIALILYIYISKNKTAFITPAFFVDNKKYTKTIALVFLIYLSQFVFAFLYTFIIQDLYDALDQVSYILLPGYVVGALIGGISEKTIAKLGKYNTVTIGISMIVLGLALTGLFMNNGKVLLSITGILFFGGYNMIYSPMIDTVTSLLPQNEVGRGIGLNDLTINIASSIGVAIGSRLMISKFITNFNFLSMNSDIAIYRNIMFLFALIATISLIIYRANKKLYNI